MSDNFTNPMKNTYDDLVKRLDESTRKNEELNQKLEETITRLNEVINVNANNNKIAEVSKNIEDENIITIDDLLASEEPYTIKKIDNISANIGENGQMARTTMLSADEISNIVNKSNINIM